MGEFNSDDHYIYYCCQEYLIRNGVALILKKKKDYQYLFFECSSKNEQNDLSSFPRQTIQHHSIQVYAPSTNAEEAEVNWFNEDLQNLTPKRISFPS